MTQIAQDCCSANAKNALRKEHAIHPDHSTHLGRLNRIKGQIDGVEKMITDRRYCFDIITQLRAISAAAKALEGAVLETHLKGCVHDAMLSKDSNQANEKIEEIIALFKRGTA